GAPGHAPGAGRPGRLDGRAGIAHFGPGRRPARRRHRSPGPRAAPASCRAYAERARAAVSLARRGLRPAGDRGDGARHTGADLPRHRCAEEIAGDAGLLVDPFDAADIARGISVLAGDDDVCAELRRRGPLNAARFSPAESAAMLDQAYR